VEKTWSKSGLRTELRINFKTRLRLSTNIITDEQIRLSSGNVRPRLFHSTWMPNFKKDKEPMVEIDFRKYTMIRAIQIISPMHHKFGILSMAREIMIEYFDLNGEVIQYNNGKFFEVAPSQSKPHRVTTVVFLINLIMSILPL